MPPWEVLEEVVMKSDEQKAEEFQRCCLELWGVLRKYDDYATSRQSLLAVLTTMYCMAECIPDAIKKFRDDIPRIEKTIRNIFGDVDQMAAKGREMAEEQRR